MLTRVSIKNFKRLGNVDIDLAETVVFVGPNNSGKTSALQALALWEAGLRAWVSKRANSEASKRTGVTINRRDLIALSVPAANLLWRDLHVRSQTLGKTSNVLIEILVEGHVGGQDWVCGFEFDYANPESFYCRPLRRDAAGVERYPLPDDRLLKSISMAFLPAMSGLASVEPRIERGRINVLIGEGQTAQVLRNLCHGICIERAGSWKVLKAQMADLFGVELLEPEYIAERGEILMSYQERSGITLDLSSAGRGLQQTLLLLAYLHLNPGTILLLDEPDAHLEILRQRQVYNLLQQLGHDLDCQIIAASHSEVVLNEAIERDKVVAFVGKPHTVARSQQVQKALQQYGFEHYYQAEEKGWVLYLEGSTDLSILQQWAGILGHPAKRALAMPFVHYIQSNEPGKARDHFYALREANERLRGVALFDHIPNPLNDGPFLLELMWQRREIENYLSSEAILVRYVAGPEIEANDMFQGEERDQRIAAMRRCIASIEQAVATLGRPSVWSAEIKATDDFLEPVFKLYAESMKSTVLRKTRFHELASVMRPEEIAPEIVEKLDAIWAVAEPFEHNAG